MLISKTKKIISIFLLTLFLFSFLLPFSNVLAASDDIICPNTTPTEILIYFHGLLTQKDYAESLSTFKAELNQIKSQRPGVIGVHPVNNSANGSWGDGFNASYLTKLVSDVKANKNCPISGDLPVALAGHSAGGRPIIKNPTFPAWKIILLDAIYQKTEYQTSQCPKIRVIDGSSTNKSPFLYTQPLVSQCKNESGFVYIDNKTSNIEHFATRAKLSDFYLDSPATPEITSGTKYYYGILEKTTLTNQATCNTDLNKYLSDTLKINISGMACWSEGNSFYYWKMGTKTSPLFTDQKKCDDESLLDRTNKYQKALDLYNQANQVPGYVPLTFKDNFKSFFACSFDITLPPPPVVAKTETDYYPLAPLPGIGETCTENAGKTICVKTAPEDCVTDAQGNKTCKPGPGFAGYLNAMIRLFIGICAVLAMIMIIMGGLQYMTSELISSKEEGKKKVTQAVLGLLLALGAFAILNTLNPDLLDISLSKLPTVTITIMPETENYISTPYTESSITIPTGPIPNCKEGIKKFEVGSKQFYLCGSIATKVQNLIGDALNNKYGEGAIMLGGAGFRSTNQQIAFRKAHCNGNITDANALCTPPTALPGKSRHEAGLAFDFTCNGYFLNTTKNPNTKKCFDWLTAHAGSYGLKNLLSENWHWSTDGF